MEKGKGRIDWRKEEILYWKKKNWKLKFEEKYVEEGIK